VQRYERLAIAGVTAVLLALTFSIFTVWDQTVPAGTSALFEVLPLPQGMKSDEAVAAVREGLRQAGATVYLQVADPNDPERVRVLYRFGADSSAPTESECRDFTRGQRTKVLDATEIGRRDLSGIYTWDKSTAALDLFIGDLLKAGIVAVRLDNVGVALAVESATASGLMPLAGACLIGLFVAFAYGTVIRRRRDAVLAVHGRSAAAQYFRDLGAFVGNTLGIGLILSGCGTLWLGWYNHWSQLPRFAVWVAVALAAMVAVTVIFHASAYLIRPPLELVRLLKGARPLLHSAMVAGLAQALALALLFVTAGSVGKQFEQVAGWREFEKEWLGSSDLVSLGLVGNLQKGEDATRFGTFIREQDARRQVVMVWHSGDYQQEEPSVGIYVSEDNTMAVNPGFLERVSVLDSSGNRIQPRNDRFTVWIPEDLKQDTELYVSAGLEFAEWEALGMQDREVLPGVELEPEVGIMKAGQTIFTFSDDNLFAPAALTNPVIFVVPLGLDIMSPVNLSAVASQGKLLFADSAAVEDALATESFGAEFELGALRASRALDRIADAARDARLATATVLITEVVLLLTTAIMVASFCLRNRQSLFVRYINGRNSDRTLMPFVLFSFGIGGLIWLLAISCGWVTGGVANTICATSVIANTILCWLLARMWTNKARAEDVKRY
jgi:hypothetical protein